MYEEEKEATSLGNHFISFLTSRDLATTKKINRNINLHLDEVAVSNQVAILDFLHKTKDVKKFVKASEKEKKY